jgi:hypothetical protein
MGSVADRCSRSRRARARRAAAAAARRGRRRGERRRPGISINRQVKHANSDPIRPRGGRGGARAHSRAVPRRRRRRAAAAARAPPAVARRYNYNPPARPTGSGGRQYWSTTRASGPALPPLLVFAGSAPLTRGRWPRPTVTVPGGWWQRSYCYCRCCSWRHQQHRRCR